MSSGSRRTRCEGVQRTEGRRTARRNSSKWQAKSPLSHPTASFCASSSGPAPTGGWHFGGGLGPVFSFFSFWEDGDKRARRRAFRRQTLSIEGGQDQVVGALSMVMSRREAVRGHIGPAADERNDRPDGGIPRGGRGGGALTTKQRCVDIDDDILSEFSRTYPRRPVWWGFWGILALSPESPSSQTSPIALSSFLSWSSHSPFSTAAPTI